MIYTVTLNPAIDKTAAISNFAAGKVNRIRELRIDAGGKGVNVSKCLNNLGVRSTAAVILGGAAGKELLALLSQMRIDTLTVFTSGETRTNLKIADREKGENTDINEPGPDISRAELLELKELLKSKIHPGDILIFSGSLPANADISLYREWIRFFSDRGAAVFLDSDGAAMKEGIKAIPYLIKPNKTELSYLSGKDSLTQSEMIAEGERLLKSGIKEIIISAGAEGAIFISDDGKFKTRALNVPVFSTVGAGDAMVAAMAYGMERKLKRMQTMKLAAAMGAASVMSDGTQAPSAKLVWGLAEKVVIEKI